MAKYLLRLWFLNNLYDVTIEIFSSFDLKSRFQFYIFSSSIIQWWSYQSYARQITIKSCFFTNFDFIALFMDFVCAVILV